MARNGLEETWREGPWLDRSRSTSSSPTSRPRPEEKQEQRGAWFFPQQAAAAALEEVSWRAGWIFGMFFVVSPPFSPSALGRLGGRKEREAARVEKEKWSSAKEKKAAFFAPEQATHAATPSILLSSLTLFFFFLEKTLLCSKPAFARFRNPVAASLLFLCVSQVRPLSSPLPPTQIGAECELRGRRKRERVFLAEFALARSTRSAVAASTVFDRSLSLSETTGLGQPTKPCALPRDFHSRPLSC